MKWVYNQALIRAEEYGIPGVTYQLTQGVTKNIIPAIASTNAIVAAVCSLEALKLITLCSMGLDNNMMYVGTDGVYTLTSKYEKDEYCPLCSSGTVIRVSRNATLQECMDVLVGDVHLKGRVEKPSLSYGSRNLYVRGALEEMTRPNLTKTMADLLYGSNGDGESIEELVESGAELFVNDPALVAPLKIRLILED